MFLTTLIDSDQIVDRKCSMLNEHMSWFESSIHFFLNYNFLCKEQVEKRKLKHVTLALWKHGLFMSFYVT